MNETIKGSIKKILTVQTGTAESTGNEWKKVTFIVANNEGFEGKEQIFAFDIFGADKVDKFIQYNKEKRNVEVSFNIQTNEYKDKYYTSLQAWKVFGTDMSADAGQDVAQTEDDSSDLPF